MDGKQEIHPEYDGRQLSVTHISCSPDGDMVVSSHDDKIYILNSEGAVKTQLTTPEIHTKKQIGSVRSVCLSPQGYIVIVDYTSHAKVFTPKGQYIQCLDTVALNEVSSPPWVRCGAIDLQDNLVVGDSLENCINVTARTFPEGKLVRRIKCKQQDTIGRHPSMVVNSHNQILVHSYLPGSVYTHVVAIDYTGNVVFSFTPQIDTNDTDRVWPGGIACDENDNIYVAMTAPSNGGHVHAYSPRGGFQTCISDGLYKPSDLSVTPDGKILVADFQSIVVLNYPNTSLSEYD